MSSHPIDQARNLKQLLITDILEAEGELAIALESYTANQLALLSKSAFKGSDRTDFIVDQFLTEGTVGDRPVIQYLIDLHPEFTESEQEMILQWSQAFVGLFKVTQAQGSEFEIMNWLTAKSYGAIYPETELPAQWQRLQSGDIILSRILPITSTQWIFSGPSLLLGRLGDAKLAVAIGSFKQNHGDSLYADAPQLLEQAWQSVEAAHQDFIDYFGGETFTMSGVKLHQKLQDYQAHLTQKELTASGIDGDQSIQELYESSDIPAEEMEETLQMMGVEGKTVKKIEQQPLSTMMRPTLELPKALRNASEVTVLTDARGGQVFLTTYRDLEKHITQVQDASPEEVTAQLNLHLQNSDVKPFVWERLAKQYPKALSRFFKVGLQREKFDLETDLTPVLADYHSHLQPQLPETASVPLHLHELFQRAVAAAKLTKTKKKSKAKTSFGFGGKQS